MNPTTLIKLTRYLATPAAYTAVMTIYWSYALYQRLTLAEFNTFLIITGLIALAAWIVINRKLPKSTLLVWGVIFLALVALESFVYYFLTSLPTGWGNLNY